MRCGLRRDVVAAASGRRGQVIVLFAAAVVLLAMMCAMALDVGRIVTCQAELQNAVDAAALAGASQLVGEVDDDARAVARAQAVSLAVANTVDGTPLTLESDDVTFGHYDEETGAFVPMSALGPSAVIDSIRVAGNRVEGSAGGPIPLYFAPIFGIKASAHARYAVGTQPRRYVVFAMDRSGSMCYDTTGVDRRTAPNSDASMSKSPTGWYWMPKQVYTDSWKTARFCAKDDVTGEVATDFLPKHIKDQMLSGQYFRYCSRDEPSAVQSGWLRAPSNVTLYSYYGPDYLNWRADAYGPVSSCAYALATGPIEPMASSQNAGVAFVDLLRTGREQAGLVTYAKYATLEHQLTDDWDALRSAMVSYDPRDVTATPAGLKAAIDEILLSGRADGFGQRILILLTDGMANTVGGTNYNNPSSRVSVSFMGEATSCYVYQAVATALEEQVQRARRNGIRIYAVSFGNGADRDLMPKIARATNGAYYYAPDSSNLTDIFVDIFYNLPAVLTG